MKRIFKLIKNNLLGFILGVIISGATVYAATLAASNITYDKTNSIQYGATQDTAQGAINELYEIANNKECKSGYTKKNETSVNYVCSKPTFADIILADNPTIKTTPLTLTNSTADNGESGLYQLTTANGYGGTGTKTYFFRGDVNNNVVSFAGMLWRIIRINEDGTVRLILDTSIDTTTHAFNSTFNDYTYMYYSNSEIPAKLYTWFTSNITGSNASKVATGNYFCEAARVAYSSSYATAGSASLAVYSSYTPDLSCVTDGNTKGIVNSNIGLITYDEVVLAGGYYGKTNQSYYLYKGIEANNNYNWWTMSPAGFSNNLAYAWYVSTYGGPFNLDVLNALRLRPVINLKADTLVTKNASGQYVVE